LIYVTLFVVVVEFTLLVVTLRYVALRLVDLLKGGRLVLRLRSHTPILVEIYVWFGWFDFGLVTLPHWFTPLHTGLLHTVWFDELNVNVDYVWLDLVGCYGLQRSFGWLKTFRRCCCSWILDLQLV